MTDLHDFQDDLAYSKEQTLQPWWTYVYRRFFVGYSHMTDHSGDMEMQAKGIDRTVHLKNGRHFHIDEKVRRKAYNDVLLEIWSKAKTENTDAVPGWIQKNLHVDFIAYAFEPTNCCFLLPFPALRLAWMDNRKEWCERFPLIRAENRDEETGDSWTTESVAVPLPVIFPALIKAQQAAWPSENGYAA